MAALGSGNKGARRPEDTPYTPEWYARQNAASTARYAKQAALVPTIVTAPGSGVAGAAAAAVAKKYVSTKPAAKATSTSKAKASGGGSAASSSASSGGSYADGYNKAVAEANARKNNDAPQVAALEAMIASGFGQSRDQKLANLDLLLSQQDKILLDDYLKRAGGLEASRADNEKSEHDSSFANLANRARERSDILMQATSQGAGESDTLRATLQALRNWSANQSEVNRSYFDTMRSVNSAVTDLNTDTRTARTNLHTAANSDRESVWTNFYNQTADAYTQLGNIRGNPNSDSYLAGHDSFAKAAETVGQAYKSPGIPATVTEWEGSSKAEEKMLNNAAIESMQATNLGTTKRPEGATLRKW